LRQVGRMSEGTPSGRLEFLSIWGEEYVRSVVGSVTSNPKRLRRLARIRFEQASRIESAITRLSQPGDVAARQAYALSLPETIQEIIILECVMELNRSLKQTTSNLN